MSDVDRCSYRYSMGRDASPSMRSWGQPCRLFLNRQGLGFAASRAPAKPFTPLCTGPGEGATDRPRRGGAYGSRR
jgi:hypothetical protein